MKLFLSGGGDEKKSEMLDRKFSEALDKSKPLLYIPIAIDTKRFPYPGCLDWIKSCLGKFNVKDIVMWTEEDLKKSKEQDFNCFSGVYIGGGNTFKLLKNLKEFGTFDILKKLIKEDIPVYGGSAGAIIMGKTILSASLSDPNIVNLREFSSFNLINEYEIWPHYKEQMDKDIFNYQNKKSSKVIALPEDSGLCVNDKEILVVGRSSSFIFNQIKQEIKPGFFIPPIK